MKLTKLPKLRTMLSKKLKEFDNVKSSENIH